MKHYQLTSDAFTGFVDLYFNDLGLLTEFRTKTAELSEKQQIWILKQMPRELPELQQIVEGAPNLKLTEIKQEITFEMFWNKYDHKKLSSRIRTEAKWNKMNKTNKMKAYNYIYTYFSLLKPGTERKYAETYLNAELYNN
jgi:triacylglycerol esterase/lipase EstA (alpha/beta hydrolase family)